MPRTLPSAPRQLSTALVTLFALLLAVPSQALAQGRPTSAEAKAKAGQRFQRGVELYNAGQFDGALAEFLEAYNIAPNWRVRYNIGQIHFQLKDYAEAIREFQRYLDESGGELSAERKAEVSKSIAALRMQISAISVTANVPTARVTIDGRDVGVTPVDSHIVNLGRHRVAVDAPGYHRQEKIVQVTLDGSEDWQVQLQPIEGYAGPRAKSRGAGAQRESSEARAPEAAVRVVPAPTPWGVIASATVGVLGSGAAVAFGAMAMSSHNELTTALAQPAPNATTVADLRNRLNTQVMVGTICAGVGAAGSVIALIAAAASGPSKDSVASSKAPATTFNVLPTGVELRHTF